MTEDRKLVMKAVLDGELDASHVTLEEIQELEELVFDLIASRVTPFDTYEVMQ
jgi:hypothetical protein